MREDGHARDNSKELKKFIYEDTEKRHESSKLELKPRKGEKEKISSISKNPEDKFCKKEPLMTLMISCSIKILRVL